VKHLTEQFTHDQDTVQALEKIIKQSYAQEQTVREQRVTQ